jgi:hypothetical protein
MQANRRLQQRLRLLADERVRKLIGRRAYELYLERGGGQGKAQEDWARAEEDMISLLQELIESESQLEILKKSEAKVRTISPVPQRSSKTPPPISPLKKKPGATLGPKRKAAPKKKGKITSPAKSSPLSTI